MPDRSGESMAGGPRNREALQVPRRPAVVLSHRAGGHAVSSVRCTGPGGAPTPAGRRWLVALRSEAAHLRSPAPCGAACPRRPLRHRASHNDRAGFPTRADTNEVSTPWTTSVPHLASCEARGLVDPPVVVTVGPKHPLFLGGVYEPPRAARRIAGPAFARRGSLCQDRLRPEFRRKRASGACSFRASALIEAVVRAGVECSPQGGDEGHRLPNHALLLSPTSSRLARRRAAAALPPEQPPATATLRCCNR